MQAKSYYKPCARSTETIPGALLWADVWDPRGTAAAGSRWLLPVAANQVALRAGVRGERSESLELGILTAEATPQCLE